MGATAALYREKAMVIWACAVSVVTIIIAPQRHVNTARREINLNMSIWRLLKDQLAILIGRQSP